MLSLSDSMLLPLDRRPVVQMRCAGVRPKEPVSKARSIGYVPHTVSNARESSVPFWPYLSYALLRSFRISEPISSARRPSIHCIASAPHPQIGQSHLIDVHWTPRESRLTTVCLGHDHSLQRGSVLPAPGEAEVVRALLGTGLEVDDVRVHPYVLR